MKNTKELFPVEASVLSQHALEEIIRREYFPEHGDVICKLHYRSIHDTCAVVCNETKYYFKVYRHGLRTEEEIRAEIGLLRVLKNSEIPATEPVMTKNGEYILCFNAAEGFRYGVLYTVAGVKPSGTLKETDNYNRKLGLYLSSIHKAWDRIDHPVNRWHMDTDTFISWSMEYIRGYRQWYEFDLSFLEELAETTIQRIKQVFTKDSPGYGICHGDFNPGNFRFDANDNPVLFDFDFSGYGWRVYDMSVYINAFSLGWDEAGREKRKRRREAFLDGYLTNMTIPDIQLQNMDLFIPFRRLFNIGTLYVSLSNTWGDNWVTFNLDDDIEALKKWIVTSEQD